MSILDGSTAGRRPSAQWWRFNQLPLLLPWIEPLLTVAAVTAFLFAVGHLAAVHYMATCYLIPVALAASRWGGWSAAWASLASAAAAAFFLFPPIYSLRVDSPHQLFDLSVFGVLAAVMGYLVLGIRANARAARARGAEVEALHRFSQRLAGTSNSADIYAAIQDHLSTLTDRRVVVVQPGPFEPRPAGLSTLPRDVVAAIEVAAGSTDRIASGTSLPTITNGWMIRPLLQANSLLGIVAVDVSGADDRVRRSTVGQIDTALDEAAASLERINVANAIAEAQVRSEAETLRQALIGSVSHELCTPLASILGAASILADARPVVDDPRLGTLAGVIRDEAERLNADIQTLLDASRISSNSVTPRLVWTDVTDVVNAAIERRRKRLADRDLVVDMPADVPLVRVDTHLIEQALGQILDNAGKYSPAGSRIELAVKCDEGSVVISVADQGMGIARDEIGRIWDRFYRSPRTAAATPGSGLGLWVARSLANASGAAIEAWSPGPEKGSVLTIRIPVTKDDDSRSEGPANDEPGRSGD